MIELRLRLPIASEKRLRRYVKKEFETTLEKKLQCVLIEWMGTAVGHIAELQRNSNHEL